MSRIACCSVVCACLVLANQPALASEARTVVVKPSNMNGWTVAVQKGTLDESGEGMAVGEFTTGEFPSPLGKGSFYLKVGCSYKNPLSKVYLGTNEFSGVSPSRITQFKLSVCPVYHETKGAQPVTVEIALGSPERVRLYTFLPWGFDPPGYYRYGQWREINLMKPGGAWELTNIESTDKRGLWWPESSCCRCYVDKLIIGYLDDTGKEIVTTYDFEPDAEPQPSAATKPQ